jgi:hypothetical protein
MSKYEKAATFLVRLACVVLWTWSALRLVLFLCAAFLSNGFRYSSGWPLLLQSALPGVAGLCLHFLKPQIVSYLTRDLGD